MRIYIHRRFEKKFRKLRKKEQSRFLERRDIFKEDPFSKVLENHPLHGEYADCRSINVGGDLRAVYRPVENDAVLFVDIGTHHELFGS